MMMTRFFSMFALLMFSAPLFAQDVKDGLRLLDVEKYNEACTWFQSKVDAQPAVTLYLYLAGEAQLMTGNVAKADELFSKGLSAEAGSPLFVAAKGAVLADQGKADEAKVAYEKAYNMCATVNDATVLMYTARALMIAGEVKGADYALKIITRVISLDKKGTNADAHFLAGLINWELGNGGDAIRAYEHCSEMDKTTAKPFWKLGFIYTRVKNAEAAKPNYDKALQMDPGLAPMYRDLGDFYFFTNQTAKAIESYKKYLSMIDNNNDARLKYASFLLINKQYAPAFAEAKELDKLNFKNVYLFRVLGYAGCEVDSVKDALRGMETFINTAPPNKVNATDYAYYCKLLTKAGQDSLAGIYLDKAIGAESKLAVELLSFRADFYYKAKKYQLCVDNEKRLLEVKTSNTAGDYFLMGRAYYQLEQYGPADTAFMKVVELSPTYIPGYSYRGKSNRAFEKAPDEGKAKPFYEKVIELATDPVKYKRDLIEANTYLARHYYLKKDNANAKIYYSKVLELDPNDAEAKKMVAAIK